MLLSLFYLIDYGQTEAKADHCCFCVAWVQRKGGAVLFFLSNFSCSYDLVELYPFNSIVIESGEALCFSVKKSIVHELVLLVQWKPNIRNCPKHCNQH